MKSTLGDRWASLEKMATTIGDTDSEWWPFGFLRPAPHERLGSARCFLISLLHGLPVALLGLVASRLVGDEVRGAAVWIFPLSVIGIFFVLFRGTFAVFWNRRAARLRPLHVRRTAWLKDAGREPGRRER